MDIQSEINNNPVLKQVQELLINQTVKGLEKYGRTVNPNGLSTTEWIDHASEEIIDLLVYLQILKAREGHGSVVLSVSYYNELLDENKRLREALEFYANPTNYEVHGNVPIFCGQEHVGDTPECIPVSEDNGEIARKALAGESNG